MASPQGNRNSCPTIYFAKIPSLQDLCTVSLQVTSDSPGISNISQFGSQPQIIKCRELIFTEPSVLASPSLQEQGLIFVIIPQSFWKTGKLQERCQKSGLKINKPTRVIPAIFQACLSYTLKAKLAPLWNKAGDLYIQGRDFLTTSTKANAIGVEINVTDAEICIAVKPTIVKLCQSDIRDFDIAPGVLDHFFASIDNTIPEYAIEDKWCHILPSLKKGKLVSITHRILPSSPFKTYKDIRRYWKNAYGYRLPESDTGIIYYNIYFPAIGNTLFTYPDFCVFKREPVLLPRADPMTIIPAFLSDVQTKLPTICGFSFKVNPKAQYLTTGLYQASIQNNSLSHLTLATVPPQNPNYPIRHVPNLVPNNHNGLLPQHRSSLPNRVLSRAFDVAFQQAGNSGQSIHTQKGPAMHIATPMNSRPMASPVSEQLNRHGRCITPQHGARLLSANMQSHHTSASPIGLDSVSPIVLSSSQIREGSIPQHETKTMNTQITKYRPILPASPPPAPMHLPRRLTYQSPPAGMSRSATAHSPYAVATQHTAIHHSPLMSPKPAAQHPPQLNQGIPTYQSSNASYTSHQVSPYPGQMINRQVFGTTSHRPFQFPTSPPPLMETPVPQQSPSPVVAKIVPSFRPHKPRNLSSQSQGSLQTSSKVVPLFKASVKRCITPTFAARLQLDFDAEPKDGQHLLPGESTTTQPGSCPGTSHHPPVKPSFSSIKTPSVPVNDMPGKSVKRRAKDNECDPSHPTPKKPRAKPKVQDVDMQALMINDQLSKVNTVTLVTWLKEKNIKVKSREKKPDLISKVISFINAKSKEH